MNDNDIEDNGLKASLKSQGSSNSLDAHSDEVLHFSINDPASEVKKQRFRNFIAIGFCLLVAGVFLFGCIHIYPQSGVESDDLIGLTFSLFAAAISAYMASNFFVANKVLNQEVMNFEINDNKGFKISAAKISISPLAICKSGIRKYLARNYLTTLDLNWDEIKVIKVKPRVDSLNGGGFPALYEFHLNGSNFTAQKYIPVIRSCFFGQEDAIIKVFHKFAKCPIDLRDELR